MVDAHEWTLLQCAQAVYVASFRKDRTFGTSCTQRWKHKKTNSWFSYRQSLQRLLSISIIGRGSDYYPGVKTYSATFDGRFLKKCLNEARRLLARARAKAPQTVSRERNPRTGRLINNHVANMANDIKATEFAGWHDYDLSKAHLGILVGELGAHAPFAQELYAAADSRYASIAQKAGCQAKHVKEFVNNVCIGHVPSASSGNAWMKARMRSDGFSWIEAERALKALRLYLLPLIEESRRMMARLVGPQTLSKQERLSLVACHMMLRESAVIERVIDMCEREHGFELGKDLHDTHDGVFAEREIPQDVFDRALAAEGLGHMTFRHRRFDA